MLGGLLKLVITTSNANEVIISLASLAHNYYCQVYELTEYFLEIPLF